MPMQLRVSKRYLSTYVVEPSISGIPPQQLTESELVGCNFSDKLTEHIRENLYFRTVVKKYLKEEPLIF